jgi:hypothetical protein
MLDGGVVGGDAQNVVKNPELVARRNERFTQVLTRVLAGQMGQGEKERLRDPVVVVVDVVGLR